MKNHISGAVGRADWYSYTKETNRRWPGLHWHSHLVGFDRETRVCQLPPSTSRAAAVTEGKPAPVPPYIPNRRWHSPERTAHKTGGTPYCKLPFTCGTLAVPTSFTYSVVST
ncbi:unnamed protein product [Pieris brassicae]|uniref:Uncharacterized protein n=1 Tax=Pieris brassicae TaxID=7116 RepID=A0A9P0TM08_PIEBR|nr:unnamed protein product [Pieris brassicae]